MMKKIIALVLAVVLCLSLVGILSGCGGKKTLGGGGGAVSGDVIDGTNLHFDETIELNMWLPDNTDLEMEGCYMDTLIEETLNIKFNITEYEARDQYETLVAQQKIPQLTFANAQIFGPAYGSLGAYIDWNDYIDLLPNVKKVLSDPKWAEDIAKYTEEDGSMYHLPVPQTGYADTVGWLYRKDIFDKHGMTFPTNQEDLMATLRKLKELYPNSYPLVIRGLNGANLGGVSNMIAPFGGGYAGESSWNTLLMLNMEDHSYYMGQTDNAMRECMQWMHDLYEEGLLHPSCITMDSAQWTEAFASNTSFVGYDKMDRIDMLTMGAIDANPSYVLTGARNFPMGTNGTNVFPAHTTGFSFLVSGMIEGEELENVLKYVDWLYSDEGIKLTNWGKEGESYEVAADGTMDFKEDFTYEGSGIGVVGMCAFRDFDTYLKSQDQHVIDAIYDIAKDYTSTDKQGYRLEYDDNEQRVFDTYYQKTYDFCNAKFQDFIRGELNPETDWDAYVAEVNGMLPQEVYDIHNNALQRYLEKHPEYKLA